jgi:glycosyltransferase involved in cell wall biosynthesis
MIDPTGKKLSLSQQPRMLGICRSSMYYKRRRIESDNLELMRLIDEQYLKTPSWGNRSMRTISNSYKSAKRYRILCAIDSLTGGGAEKVLSQIVNHLDPKCFDMQVVMTLGEDIKQQIAPHVKLVSLNMNAPKALGKYDTNIAIRLLERSIVNFLRPAHTPTLHNAPFWISRYQHLIYYLRSMFFCAALLGRYARAMSPDCILSFLPLTNLLCIWARRWYRLRVPLVLSDRNYLSREIENLPWPRLHRQFVRFFYPKAEHHVTVSEASAADLAKNYGISETRITTIYNGVDRELIAAAAQAPLKFISTPGEVRLVAAGRLHKQKGFDLLLDALAQTRRRNWRLWLLGSGPDEAVLRQQVKSLGLDECVEFLGHDTNPWRWFSRADIFVLCSRWEGLPNVLIEAMALGLPVIAANCPSGPAEILANGHWGRLVASESPVALAAAIDEFIINPKQRAVFARRAKQRSADFDIKSMVSAYTKFLLDTIETDTR